MSNPDYPTSMFIEDTDSSPAICSSFCGEHNGNGHSVAFPYFQRSGHSSKGIGQVDRPDEEADKYLAKEMAELSAEERERYAEEVHGAVVEVPEENPIFVDQCLQQMEEEIQKVRNRSAYNRAHFLNPSMVGSRKFRLMFLRYALFDPRLAAKRIILHFKHKLEIFDEEKLARPITQDDLDEDDMLGLYNGTHQPIRCGTDSVGRVVLFMFRKNSSIKTWQSAMRCTWYQQMVALEDEEVQKRGVVMILYEVDCRTFNAKLSTDMVRKTYVVKDGIPVRLAAFHYCYDNIAIRPGKLIPMSGNVYQFGWAHVRLTWSAFCPSSACSCASVCLVASCCRCRFPFAS